MPFRIERELCFVPCDSLEIGLWLHERLNGKRFTIRLHSLKGEIDFEFMIWAYAQHRPQFGFSDEETTLLWLIRQGRWEELWLVEQYPKAYFGDPFAGCRDMEVNKWLCLEYEWKEQDHKTLWIQASMECAAEFENVLDVVTFLLDACPDADCARAMSIATQHGHLLLVQFLLSHGARALADAMDRAAWSGHLNILQWLHVNRSEGCTTQAMDLAAGTNHMEVVQWLHSNRSEGGTPHAMDEAAGNGHLEMVQWLYEHRPEGCMNEALGKAAAGGYLDVVKWLNENRSATCSSKALEQVACTGRLDIAQYLHDQAGVHCTYLMFKNATMNGHLELLRWAWEEEYADFDVDTWHDSTAIAPLAFCRL